MVKENKLKIMWPAIIRHSDDVELIYVRNQAEWDNNTDLHSVEYDEADCLVDSSGQLFKLTTRINDQVEPQPTGEFMPLLDILGVIKAHAAQTGSCCVAKLYAPTINDAFKILESLIET